MLPSFLMLLAGSVLVSEVSPVMTTLASTTQVPGVAGLVDVIEAGTVAPDSVNTVESAVLPTKVPGAPPAEQVTTPPGGLANFMPAGKLSVMPSGVNTNGTEPLLVIVIFMRVG